MTRNSLAECGRWEVRYPKRLSIVRTRLEPIRVLKREIRPRSVTLYSVPLVYLGVAPAADVVWG